MSTNDKKEGPLHEVFNELRQYIDTNVKIATLKAVDKASDIASNLAVIAVLVLVGGLFFLMLNIGLGFWIGSEVGETYWGFLILAAFYLLVLIILYLFRDKIIKKPVSDGIIKSLNP